MKNIYEVLTTITNKGRGFPTMCVTECRKFKLTKSIILFAKYMQKKKVISALDFCNEDMCISL